jgi:hypothetical protein
MHCEELEPVLRSYDDEVPQDGLLSGAIQCPSELLLLKLRPPSSRKTSEREVSSSIPLQLRNRFFISLREDRL